MKEEKKITLNEKDLAKILAEKFGLDENETKVTIYKYDSGNDPRERDYTEITVIGKVKQI